MAIETERKFLVTTTSFKELSYAHSHIVQGYICSALGKTVRVRIRDDQGFLTIKGPSADGGISHFEWEKQITLQEAQALMPLCEPGMIDKVRYLVKSGNHVFEVDEFAGENEGLVVAEVELVDADEPFVKPDFVGREVTGDRRYYNAQLTRRPYSLWKDEGAATDSCDSR